MVLARLGTSTSGTTVMIGVSGAIDPALTVEILPSPPFKPSSVWIVTGWIAATIGVNETEKLKRSVASVQTESGTRFNSTMTNWRGPTSCSLSDALRGTHPLAHTPLTMSVRATPGGAISGTTVTDAENSAVGGDGCSASAACAATRESTQLSKTGLNAFMSFPFLRKARAARARPATQETPGRRALPRYSA